MKIFQMFITAMPTEQVQLCPQHCHCVCISSHWYQSTNLRLNPGHCIKVEYLNIIETFVTVVPTEHVELAADAGHCVTSTR